MDNFNKITLNKLLKLQLYEIVLIITFLLIIFISIYKKFNISEYSNNLLTYSSILVIILILFKCCNPIIGIFFIITVIILFNNIKFTNNPSVNSKLDNNNHVLTDNNIDNHKSSELSKTLEVEQVNNIKKPIFNLGKKTYNPILCNNHNASLL